MALLEGFLNILILSDLHEIYCVHLDHTSIDLSGLGLRSVLFDLRQQVCDAIHPFMAPFVHSVTKKSITEKWWAAASAQDWIVRGSVQKILKLETQYIHKCQMQMKSLDSTQPRHAERASSILLKSLTGGYPCYIVWGVSWIVYACIILYNLCIKESFWGACVRSAEARRFLDGETFTHNCCVSSLQRQQEGVVFDVHSRHPPPPTHAPLY